MRDVKARKRLLRAVDRFLAEKVMGKNGRPMLNPEKVKKIILFDQYDIGDMIITIPLLRLLKKSFPESEISIICKNCGKTILEPLGIIRRFFIRDEPLDLLGSRENRRKTNEFLRQINEQHYELAVHCFGGLRNLLILGRINSDFQVSYGNSGGGIFITHPFYQQNFGRHFIEDEMQLLRYLGLEVREKDKIPVLSLTDSEIKENQNYIKARQLDAPFIGLHPGTRLESKRWRHYPELLKELHQKMPGYTFLLFQGQGEQLEIDQLVQAADDCGARYLVIRENLKSYIRLIALAEIVICNDSGIAHIAAAYGSRVYVIFGSIPSRIAHPYGPQVFIFEKSLKCRPCGRAVCRNHSYACLERTTVSEIIDAVTKEEAGCV